MFPVRLARIVSIQKNGERAHDLKYVAENSTKYRMAVEMKSV